MPNVQSSAPNTGMPNISAAPSVAFRAAMVVAGATQAAAKIYAAPVADEFEYSVLNLASGNTVATLDMLRAGLIVSDNPTATSLEIPSEVALLYTRVVGKDLRFKVERRGNGAFAVNFTGGGPALYDPNGVDVSLTGKNFITEYRTAGTANAWVCG